MQNAVDRGVSRRGLLKLLGGAGAVLAAGSLLEACARAPESGTGGATPSGAPTQVGAATTGGQGITFAVLPGYEQAVQATADAYKAKTGTPVTINTLPRTGYREALVGPLTAKSSAFDVIYIQDPWIAEFAEAGWIAPIDAHLNRDELSTLEKDIFPAAFKSSYYNGKLWGLPYDYGSFFLYYRKDLISKQPETFDEYLEIAKKFSKSQNPSSPLDFGTVLEGSPERVNYQEWYSFLWSWGGDVLDEKNRPIFNSPDAVESLQWRYDFKLKHKVVPPDVDNYAYPEVLNALQQGQAALAIQWNAAYPTLFDATKSPKVADKLGATLLPGKKGSDGKLGRAPFSKYWLTAMSAFSQKQTEAASFIAFFSGTEAGKLALKNNGVTASAAAWKDPEIKTRRPDASLLVDTLNSARVTPHLPEMPTIETSLAKALSEVLAGRVDAKAALDGVANDATRLLERAGRLK